MYCSLSNVVPTDPVVSTKSGHLYERSVIEKHIDAEGKCPITGEDMSHDDLLPVKTTRGVKPRPVGAASVPGLLSMLQDEWDAVMLETYTLREHLNTVRQELSQALYQHDAACRVIARITKERDTARAQLQRVLSSTAGDVDMGGKAEEEDGAGIPQRVLLRMTTLAETLSAGRKKRAMPEGLASKDALSSYSKLSTHKIHQSSKGGILCVDAHPSDPNLTVTGGVDKAVLVFNRSAGKIASKLTGHSKRVSGVSFVDGSDRVVSCSHDKTVRVWAPKGSKFTTAATLSPHSAEITDISVQPTGSYVISSSLDKTWSFSDMETGKVYTTCEPVAGTLECVAFHPDGVIFGTGTGTNLVRMWDTKTCGNVATFEGHSGVVNGVAFSENGYHMASASDDGSVRVWDLRKLKVLRELKVDGAAKSVAFDKSGKYLASGADGVTVFSVKGGKTLTSFTDHSKAVMGVSFGPAAQHVVSASLDRCLNFYGSA